MTNPANSGVDLRGLWKTQDVMSWRILVSKLENGYVRRYPSFDLGRVLCKEELIGRELDELTAKKEVTTADNTTLDKVTEAAVTLDLETQSRAYLFFRHEDIFRHEGHTRLPSKPRVRRDAGRNSVMASIAIPGGWSTNL